MQLEASLFPMPVKRLNPKGSTARVAEVLEWGHEELSDAHGNAVLLPKQLFSKHHGTPTMLTTPRSLPVG